MTSNDRITLFELGSILLQKRSWILTGAILGAFLAVIPVVFKGLEFVSRASFIPKGADNGPAEELRGIAGQFGIGIPGANGSVPLQSPAFLAELVTSPMILGPIVTDTFTVREKRGSRVPMLDLLEVRADAPTRIDDGIRVLSKEVLLQPSKAGILALSVSTEWPSVSEQVASRVLEELNKFNLRVGKSNATQEVRFVESLLKEQEQQLSVAEDRLGEFLKTNRQYQSSPDLQFEHARLERDVEAQQEVRVSLAKSREVARIRAVRDVPVLTVIQVPTAPVKPEPRGRLTRAALGALFGGVVSVFLVLLIEFGKRSRESGDPEAVRFFSLLSEAVLRQKRTSDTAG